MKALLLLFAPSVATVAAAVSSIGDARATYVLFSSTFHPQNFGPFWEWKNDQVTLSWENGTENSFVAEVNTTSSIVHDLRKLATNMVYDMRYCESISLNLTRIETQGLLKAKFTLFDLSGNSWESSTLEIAATTNSESLISGSEDGFGKLLNVSGISGWSLDFETSSRATVWISDLKCTGSTLLKMFTNQPALAGNFKVTTDSQLSKVSLNTDLLTSSLSLVFTTGSEQLNHADYMMTYLAPGLSYFDFSEANVLSAKFSGPNGDIEESHSDLIMEIEFSLLQWKSCQNLNDCTQTTNSLLTYAASYTVFPSIPLEKHQVGFSTIDSVGAKRSFKSKGKKGDPTSGSMVRSRIKGYSLELSFSKDTMEMGPVSGTLEISSVQGHQSSEIPYPTCHSFSSAVVASPLNPVILPHTDYETCCDLAEVYSNNENSPGAYFIMTESDCTLFTALEEGTVALPSVESDAGTIYIVQTALEKTSICNTCICQNEGEIVNCESTGLKFFPDFSSVASVVRVLQLSNNTFPLLLSSMILDTTFPKLERIELNNCSIGFIESSFLENFSGVSLFLNNNPLLANVAIVDENTTTPFFSEVCCEPMDRLTINPDQTVVQCGLDNQDADSLDCAYATNQSFGSNYLEYASASYGFSNQRYGYFATSAEFCCELCQETRDCAYFQWDGRASQTEEVCTLISSNKATVVEAARVSNNETDAYGGPGLIAGSSPEVRAESRVLLTPTGLSGSVNNFSSLILSDENGFTNTISIVLGDRPSRGSVWVTFDGDVDSNTEVTFSPSKVAFSAMDWAAPHLVQVTISPTYSSGGENQNIELQFIVVSCDTSFTEQRKQKFFLSYIEPPDTIGRILSLLKQTGILLAGVVLIGGVTNFYYQRALRNNALGAGFTKYVFKEMFIKVAMTTLAISDVTTDILSANYVWGTAEFRYISSTYLMFSSIGILVGVFDIGHSIRSIMSFHRQVRKVAPTESSPSAVSILSWVPLQKH